MPIIWRYLLKQYLRVLALCVATFIAILFVSRAKQIAEFAAMGAGASHVAMFALYLIPYVLPLAIPISCLISSVILFGRLSTSSELTAMRACGLALRQLTAPILLAGALLSCVNFYIASELATHCHMLGRRMEAKVATVNPLLLLQNTRLLKMGDVFVDMHTIKQGERADDVTIVLHNRQSDRLSVVKADKLEYKDDEILLGHNVNIISTLDTDKDYDHLILENQQAMWMPVSSFSHMIKRIGLSLKYSHLKLRLLFVRISQEALSMGKFSPAVQRGYSEVARRISLGLATFSFTCMGVAFGIQTSRQATKRRLFAVIALSALFIACYATAEGIGHRFLLSLALFTIPHLIIIPLSIFRLKQVTKGAEA